jgi:hypothetical protein
MSNDPLAESLANHANLRSGNEERSILHALWLRNRSAAHPDLDGLCEDLINLLVELNTRWNTSNPEAVAGKESRLDRSIVSSLTMIIVAGGTFTKNHPKDEAAYRAIRRVSIAWSAVLAGDISDLREHIKEVEAAET